MTNNSVTKPLEKTKTIAEQTVYSILFTISLSHLLNDMLQSLIPSIYPVVKTKYNLSFGDIGLITLVFQLSASLLQPFVGIYTDKRPKPYSLSIGMGFTLLGLICLAFASGFYWLLLSVCFIGIGSSVFHPESSRVAYLASGGKRGLAQSIFQLGGNAGSALGPLLAALIIVPFGQTGVLWFSLAALLAIIILIYIGKWYKGAMIRTSKAAKVVQHNHHSLSAKKVTLSVIILLILIFSKFFYLSSITGYYTFFLIDKFHLSVQGSQFHLFIFLAAVAAGTLAGGPLGDRFGRKYIIWISILGAAPFTMMLPYANLFWTSVLSVIIGVIISSAFSAILVYAQELMPGKVGMIAGLFFGFAFGMGGLGSAVLGRLADSTSINYIFQLCAYLPLIGILTMFLPNIEGKKKKSASV
ncbi:MFS transporter [Mucilaginibacter pocheonensis]|uniref:FSR family fosmidomycin resistance protein-like MFS transporter n=1 Tax=Mucilaginibacter pocheonensis TaxID=398050 RepID=A0ABU1TG54_9SPHI|nr:MFS transporter [Mucilaginibacter pocheonensis]MDR6944392.1 FSR family fosmidomycin resistance protein-like MFS transporter [Mucilaginibacter pocheonensis]